MFSMAEFTFYSSLRNLDSYFCPKLHGGTSVGVLEPCSRASLEHLSLPLNLNYLFICLFEDKQERYFKYHEEREKRELNLCLKLC